LFLAITTILAFVMATFVVVVGLLAARRYIVTHKIVIAYL